MGNAMIHALVGLSIAATGVAVASPASAQPIYKNLANEAFCLSVQGGKGEADARLITWPCARGSRDLAQMWTEVGFFGVWEQLRSSAPPRPDYPVLCIALANNGSTDDGTKAIIWRCNAGTSDQGWWLVYWGSDANDHPCFYFLNWKATGLWPIQSKVLSVAGGVPKSGTNVVLWPYQETADQIWCQY
jgi:hypothetical protein